MNVYFYKNFKKKQNSTKVPAANSHDRIISCQLKENCSIESPILRLRTGTSSTGWQDTLNYAYIPSWGRYYKVEDATYAGGDIWEVALTDDYLASNRAQILDAYAFIEYSGLSGETYVPDTRLTMRGNETVTASGEITVDALNDAYTYYVTIVSDYGADTCWEMTRYEFMKLCAELSGSAPGSSIVTKLVDQLGSVFAAISDVKAMNFRLSDHNTPPQGHDTEHVHISDQVMTIATGNCWPSSQTTPSTDDYTYTDSFTLTIPWDNAINDFRNLAPFTSFTMFLPYYGDIDLNAIDLVGATTISVYMIISVRDGTITYRPMCNNKHLGIYTAIMANNIAIGQLQGNALGMAKAGLDTAIGAGKIAFGDLGSGISQLGGGLINLGLTSLETKVNVTGQTTGLPMRAAGVIPRIRRYYHTSVTDPSNYKATIGAPYMRVDRLGAHEGYYVKTNSASVEISHYAGEADAINAALNGGVFLE